VSESSVYRILKDADLIMSLAYVLMPAADAFQNPTTRVHEMWQTGFTYFSSIGWGGYSLSTVLDEYSRSSIAWKLISTMGAADVKTASRRCDRDHGRGANRQNKPRIR
jgi:hypothetical protein